MGKKLQSSDLLVGISLLTQAVPDDGATLDYWIDALREFYRTPEQPPIRLNPSEFAFIIAGFLDTEPEGFTLSGWIEFLKKYENTGADEEWRALLDDN